VKTQSLVNAGLSLSLSLMMGCSPAATTLSVQSPAPQTPPPPPTLKKVASTIQSPNNWIHVDGGAQMMDFNPKIDILFVVDDSDSMKNHQDKIAANLGRFMEGLKANKMIDYHIGVTAGWDSTDRALTMRTASAKKGRHLFDNGELRPVKDSSGKWTANRFLTRNDSVATAARTVDIGITPYNEGGPEIEELFSPISAAIKLTGAGAANEGFFRSDAHLATVIVTDADDSRNGQDPTYLPKTSAADAYQDLLTFKNGDASKISVWGALVSAADPDSQKDWDLRITPKYNSQCFDSQGHLNGQCKGFGPARIEDLIVMSNPDDGSPEQIKKKHIMDLIQDDYGTKLLQIGSEITEKVLSKEILLSQLPQADDKGLPMIRVFYGNNKTLASGKAQEIPMDLAKGWSYNADHNSVHISGATRYQAVDGGRFDIMMAPANTK
jgi:hypothetical protein